MWKNLIFLFAFGISSISYAGVRDHWERYSSDERDELLERLVDKGSLRKLKELFKCGAKIDDIDWLSLLIPAIDNRAERVTKFFLSSGADVNRDIRNGRSRYNLLKHSIINIGNKPSWSQEWISISIDLINKGIALDHAQESLDYSIRISAEKVPSLVKAILSRGVNPNHLLYGSFLPLNTLATSYEHAEMYFYSYYGRSPSVDEKKLIRDNHKEIAIELLKAGADPDLKGTILTSFFEYWDIDSLKTLLSFTPDPNVRVEYRELLMTAFDYILIKTDERLCVNEWLQKVELLLKYGAVPSDHKPKHFSCKQLEEMLSKYEFAF